MRAVAFSLVVLVLSALQGAAGEYRADAACPVIARLSLYISGVTSFERVDECPQIIFSSNAPAAAGPVQDSAALRNIGATYYPATGAILISPFLDTESVPGQAVLLHQLVHARQYAIGMDRGLPCRALLEAQAYAVEARFLEENGYAEEAQAARLTGAMRARCSDEPDQMN
ncbi:MAG: DUF6647 family protein [Pseudomonadota bacterium]